MSFPATGSAADVAEWLGTKLFAAPIILSFANWDAEAMLGVTETDLKMKVPGDDGIRLWALLNAARSFQGKFR